MPETTIVLIRHGQTAWNKEEVFRGRADVPLDATGIRQAEALAHALRPEPIAAVVTSPLVRAFKTGELLAESRGLKPVASEGFIDMDFGIWGGLSLKDVRQRFPDLYATWLAAPQTVTFPGGESLDAVLSRAAGALAQLVEEYSGQTVAIVAHRVVNKVLICHILGLDNSRFWQIKQDTASINRFRATGTGYLLDCLNDTCHLRHLEAARADF